MNATPEPTVPTTPLVTPIDYVVGMTGRPQTGTLVYDGKGRVVLADDAGEPVFEKPLGEIGKVRRAEWAIYVKIDGKTITLMFGDYKKYALTNAVLNAPLGSDLGQLVGTLAGMKLSTDWNRQAGQDDWWDLLTAHNAAGIDASPANAPKFALILSRAILVVFTIYYFVVVA